MYPALHVYAFAALYEATDAGANIARAQLVFIALYLATLFLAADAYRRARAAPLVALLVLPLSRRAHSLFVLRLFNDGVGAPLWCVAVARSRILRGSSAASS